jgi:hypothetical protein
MAGLMGPRVVRNPDPQVDYPLTYDDAAVQHILENTLGHPYLIQLVCSCVVEQANAQGTLQVSYELVEAAEALAFERGEPYFRNVWDEMAGPDGQALLRQAAQAGRLALDALTPAVRPALERMLRLRVLRKTAAGYEVESPLVRRWVVEHAPE